MPDKPRPEGHPEPAPPKFREPTAPAGSWAAGYSSEEEALQAKQPVLHAELHQAATAVAEPVADEDEGGEKPPKPLNLEVDIRDAGPCKKHIKVTIPADDIAARLSDKFSEMVSDAILPGYRPGKAPRKLLEKKFYKDVSEQLKAELLLQSLEELAEKHKLNPLSQPNIDPFKIELPKNGPLNYEFDVEVAPEFELPNYKGLKLKRPVKEITEADVELGERRFLARYGTLVPKADPAEMDDYLVVDLTNRYQGQEIGKLKELTVKVDPQLSFKDGLIPDFGEKIKGVRAGETRQLQIVISAGSTNAHLRGRPVDATFEVKEVKSLRLPELTHDFLHTLGVHTPEQLRELMRSALQRQLDYEQRRSAREQVLQQITAASGWELPQDLLVRQARKTLGRKVMEMRQSGFTEEEIAARSNMLQQDTLANTARALKEHFVLQKIAEVEKLDVVEDDIDYEISMMAEQSGETPRRVRARLEKEDMLDTLAAQIIERKSLNLVLASAEYEDVAFEQQAAPAAVEETAAPAEEEEEKPPEATASGAPASGESASGAPASGESASGATA